MDEEMGYETSFMVRARANRQEGGRAGGREDGRGRELYCLCVLVEFAGNGKISYS